jgi:hypothetical protein
VIPAAVLLTLGTTGFKRYPPETLLNEPFQVIIGMQSIDVPYRPALVEQEKTA